jgi:nitroimidazol reductase NimA-like FMN-containing flavoprotein (pyridoxamine 5'-phosphate oxidase superfamily)
MKLRVLRAHSQVYFQVDYIEHLASWVSVIVWGEFEELANDAEKGAMHLFLDRIELLQVRETVISPHRASAGTPAPDLQGQPTALFRFLLTRHPDRFEKR